MTSLSREKLVAKINSFEYWHYPFDLSNGVVITPTHGWINAAQELRDFIWPHVVDLCGGNLKGLRVLNVGCNAGFWSLEARKSGAAYVVGIDATSEVIAQAQIVREALSIDAERLEYRQMDICGLSPDSVNEWDLCLVFRVLHHLSHPLLALERLRKV